MGNLSYFIAGFLAGVLLISGISYLPISIVSKYHAAIDECQKDLPRSQSCEITARVKE